MNHQNARPATLVVDSVVESDFISLGSGVFSPLNGFQGKHDVLSVCESSRLAGSDQVWTIPITCDISREQAAAIGDAEKVRVVSRESGEELGFLEPSEIFENPKEARIRGVFGTESPEHPGVRRVRGMQDHLVAGKVVLHEKFQGGEESPAAVRAKLKALNLKTVAGFQTRNVVHRAHEYLQRTALELCDGLLVHPVVGWKKSGDFRPEVVRHAYEKFIEAYYPKNHVVLSFLRIAMNYAGPKEAVHHALIRKNFGCTHFIVGRDHAGVGGFYGTYAAHAIFDTLPPLGIEILRLREPFYCEKCASIATDKTCGHGEAHRDMISGTKIRGILGSGNDPSGHIFRPEVLESLQKFKAEGFFYE